MRRRIVLYCVFIALLASALTGCAQSWLKDEPADLYGPGMTIGALSKLGWEIGAPTTFADAEKSEDYADNEEWRTFKQKFSAGDELRTIRNNAGMGLARFRAEKLIDSYYWVVF